jgi:RNA polymerase sigma-70 factor (ECF subfamily)
MLENRREEQIAQLLAAHQQRLSGYIRTLVPSRTDAEDVLQEVNLFIWRRSDEFKLGTNFGAWAYQIARLHVMNLRKKKPVGVAGLSDAVVEQIAAGAGSDADFAPPRLAALEACLRKLSDKDQVLVRLRYQPDATTQSVAEEVGRSLKGIYQSLNRIRVTLLDCIQRTLSSEAR